MEYANFQFPLLHIGLIAQFFLRKLHAMLEMCLWVVIFKINILKAKSHFRLKALPEYFFCHTSSLTDTTP